MDLLSLIIIVGMLVVGFWFLLKKIGERQAPEKDQNLLLLQNQVQDQIQQIRDLRNALEKKLDEKLTEANRAVQFQLGASDKLIRGVTERLVRLDETNKQVLDFSDQLKNLQDILKNPKQRGIVGEFYLNKLLENAFNPKQYELQYKFPNGDIVDAVLFLGDKKIPIDSKFSLENYNRIIEERNPTERDRLEKVFKQDLKSRIDETAKYIRPEEGTTEFAFMFIPAEGIYYDLLVNQVGAIKSNTRDLVDYAIYEKKVHIVSPTTFYVTLQSLGQGMKAYQIQEGTKEILKGVGLLEKHLQAYQEHFIKVGAHLGTTVNAYDKASREFKKIDKDVFKLTGETTQYEPLALEKPATLDED